MVAERWLQIGSPTATLLMQKNLEHTETEVYSEFKDELIPALELKVYKAGQSGDLSGCASIELYFDGDYLFVRMKHDGSSGVKKPPGFDHYTNRFMDAPSVLLISQGMLSGEYQVKLESDWRGDFLLLKGRNRRSRRTSKASVIVNLSAVFMFESLSISSGGEFFWDTDTEAVGRVPSSDFGVAFPFMGSILRPEATQEYAAIEIFMTESWKKAQLWTPHMREIQGFHFNYHDTRTDHLNDVAAAAYITKKLQALMTL